MKKLLMVVMACYALTIRAQAQESKNFLYLYSDSMIYAKKIMLRPDFSGYLQLRADSRRFPSEQVKFFSNEDGFFANTRKLTFGGLTAFSERIVEGRINVFREITYDPLLYHGGYRYRDRRQPVVNLNMYYNKGFGDLKKVNFKNLKDDMADHPESMDLLNSYRKSINASKIMYAAAGVSVVAGLVLLLKGGSDGEFVGNGFGGQGYGLSHKGPNFTSSFILLGLGTGLAVGGFSVQTSGSKHLERAVDIYNR